MNLCEVALGSNGSVSFCGQPVEIAAATDGRSEVVVGLRPESLELAGDGIPAFVEVVEELGADAYVFCNTSFGGEGETTRLVARTEARTAPGQGERVALRVRPGEAHVFDATSGKRLGPD
jgi:multiple sugar transport system ATP-binding protein